MVDFHRLGHISATTKCHFFAIDSQLSVLIEDTKCLQLLAKVYQQSGSPQQAFKALSSARDLQSK